MEKLIGANILDGSVNRVDYMISRAIFNLMLPKALTKASLHVSYIGYEKQNLSFHAIQNWKFLK
jgi:hypothetical protein